MWLHKLKQNNNKIHKITNNTNNNDKVTKSSPNLLKIQNNHKTNDKIISKSNSNLLSSLSLKPSNSNNTKKRKSYNINGEHFVLYDYYEPIKLHSILNFFFLFEKV